MFKSVLFLSIFLLPLVSSSQGMSLYELYLFPQAKSLSPLPGLAH